MQKWTYGTVYDLFLIQNIWTDKPNPLLQCVNDNDDDSNYTFIQRGATAPDYRSARSQNDAETDPATLTKVDLLSGGGGVDRTNKWADRDHLGHSHHRSGHEMGHSFLGLTSSDATASGRRRSESSGTGVLRPSRSSDYRMRYPASSAWASSGYRSIPSQFHTTNYPNQSTPASVTPASVNLRGSPAESSTIENSWKFPVYHSPLWKFPYGYPPPTSSSSSHHNTIDNIRPNLNTQQHSSLSTVEPVRYSGVASRPIPPDFVPSNYNA